MIRTLIPAPIRRRIGRTWWWLFATAPLEQYARDIADDRPYACTNGHVIRYAQLSPVQGLRLAGGQPMLCEAAACGRTLHRTVVPPPSMTLTEKVLCIADKVRQEAIPEDFGVFLLLTHCPAADYQQTVERLRELVAALAEQEAVDDDHYNADDYDGYRHQHVQEQVQARVDEAVQALTGKSVAA